MVQALDVITILIFSVLGGVMATRLRQPSVLGVLIAGAIVGPNTLGLITDRELLHLAAEIGAILLLFLVGIEFSVQKLIDLGARSVIIASIKLGLMFFFGYYIGLFFGFSPLTSAIIGAMIAMTSTVIFLKILEQKGLANRSEMPLFIAILVLEDLFGVFALTFFSSLASAQKLSTFIIVAKLVVALALLLAVYLLLLRWLKPILDWLSHYSTDDTITFIAIGLCATLSYFAHFLGLSTAAGAFLAGNIVSTLRKADAFEHAIHPFILTFTSLFFFAIGATVDFSQVAEHLTFAIVLFIATVLLTFTVISVSSYLFYMPNGKSAVFCGLAMIPLGEFSLLIAQQGSILAPEAGLVSIMAIMIFLSTLTMSLFVPHYEKVYDFIKGVLPRGTKYDLDEVARYCRMISSGEFIERMGMNRMQLRWRSILNNALGILLILAVVLIWYNATQFENVDEVLNREVPTPLILFVIGLILLFPSFGFVRAIRDTLIDLSRAFIKRYPHEVANHQKIARNVTFVVLFFCLSFFIPYILRWANIRASWAAVFIPIVLVIVYLLIKIGQLIVIVMRGNKNMAYYVRRIKEEVEKRRAMSKLKMQSYLRRRMMRINFK